MANKEGQPLDFWKNPPLRERTIRAIDDKILAQPFYTGVRSALWGLATPIDKADAEAKFPNTKLVQIDPLETYPDGTAIVGKRSRSSWKSINPTWERNFEAVGLYLGTGATYKDLGRELLGGSTKENAEQIINKEMVRILLDLGVISPSADFSRKVKVIKPDGVWNLRDLLATPQSPISQLVDAIDEGKTGRELRAQFDPVFIEQASLRLSKFGISVPYENPWENQAFLDGVARLAQENIYRDADPVLSAEIELQKRRIMEQMTRDMINLRGKDACNVSDLSSILKPLGIQRLITYPFVAEVLKDQGIFILQVPNKIREGKSVYYNYVATGDISYIQKVLRDPQFDFFTRPMPEVREFMNMYRIKRDSQDPES